MRVRLQVLDVGAQIVVRALQQRESLGPEERCFSKVRRAVAASALFGSKRVHQLLRQPEIVNRDRALCGNGLPVYLEQSQQNRQVVGDVS